MQPADLADLKARIESALAASAEEVGSDTREDDARDWYTVPFNATAAHLVNEECTRQVLTDPAVRALGGRQFSVEIDDQDEEEGTITISVMGAPQRVRAAGRGKAPAAAAAWSSEAGTGDGGRGHYDPRVRRQIRTTPTSKGGGTDLQMPDRGEASGYDEDEANGGEHEH